MIPTRIALLAVVAVLLGGCGAVAGLFGGNVFELEVGDCFDDGDLASGEVNDLPVVDCAEPHDNEVYHLFDLPDGDFPGLEAVAERADAGCLAAFEGYVGTSRVDSELTYFPITPTAPSWDTVDDREVVCAVYETTFAKITGSVRGSGR